MSSPGFTSENGFDHEAAEQAIRGNGTRRPYPVRLIHAADVLSQVRAPDYLISGLIERNTLGVSYGEFSTYKSFAALDRWLSVSTGKPYHGRAVQQGICVYIAGEGHNGLGRRMMAWALHHDIDLEHQSRFYVTSCAVPLLNADAAESVYASVSGVADQIGQPVAGVCIDTLARNYGHGDENSTRDMNQFIEHVDKYLREPFGATVELVHHTGHGDKTRERGSYALGGAMDFRLQCEKPDQNILVMTPLKNKDGETPAPMAFGTEVVRWHDGDQELSSLVLEETSYEPKLRSVTGKTQLAALNALVKICQRQRKELADSGYDPDSAKVLLSDWRQECQESQITKSRQHFHEVKDKLTEKGAIKWFGGALVVPTATD